MIYRNPWRLVCSGRLPPYCAASGGPCPTAPPPGRRGRGCRPALAINGVSARLTAGRKRTPGGQTARECRRLVGGRLPERVVGPAGVAVPAPVEQGHAGRFLLDRAA